jgi:hypothetical protein
MMTKLREAIDDAPHNGGEQAVPQAVIDAARRADARATEADRRRRPRKKLDWKPAGGGLQAGPYYIGSNGAEHTASLGKEPLGKRKTVAGAKRLCEEHAAAHPEREQRQLEVGDWPVRVAPSQQLRAELSVKQARNTRKIARLRGQVEDSAERHKMLKKEKEKEIDGIEEQQRLLADEVEHGTTATLRCYRARVGAEWVFYRDPEGQHEIDRQPAEDGAQQKLVGDVAGPRGWQDPARTALVLELLGRDYPPEPELPPHSWPEGELSWHPLVRRLQERLVLSKIQAQEGAGSYRMLPDETDEVRHHHDEQTPLQWMRIQLDETTGYRANVEPGTTAGDISYRGAYRVERNPAGGPGKGLLQAIWAPEGGDRLELPGTHRRVGDAKGEAEQHWQTRLRWLGDPGAATQLDSTGRYQLQLMGDAADDWRAEAVGMLGQPNEELTVSYVPLDEAKEICQAHADAGRWTR